MEQKKDNTEEKILNAAREVFIRKGMDGARMQEIADEAGINKALLHYYFRSKEKLFDAIFSKIIEFAFPQISKILKDDLVFATKFELIIDAYLDLLIKHPFLPGFILKEVNRDPSAFFKLVADHAFDAEVVKSQIERAMDRGEIIRMDPVHLVINIISMCVFPFAARPIVGYIAFKNDKQALAKFYSERAAVIKKFVIDSIVIK